MHNNHSPDPIAHFSNLLPEWGQAADEIYQNYHFINHALEQTERLLIPEEALNKLIDLRNLLIQTIVRLLQDLPPTTHRLSNKDPESFDRFNAHTKTLKIINHQTDEVFQQLIQQHPSLKSWFESITDE